mmetsp:Transcript_5618/g.10665  ORF Transcript_5618/g.10665 Transcript_5618/m.10665 type:complete len:276 (+) Transcript_5618:66-893(+)
MQKDTSLARATSLERDMAMITQPVVLPKVQNLALLERDMIMITSNMDLPRVQSVIPLGKDIVTAMTMIMTIALILVRDTSLERATEAMIPGTAFTRMENLARLERDTVMTMTITLTLEKITSLERVTNPERATSLERVTGVIGTTTQREEKATSMINLDTVLPRERDTVTDTTMIMTTATPLLNGQSQSRVMLAIQRRPKNLRVVAIPMLVTLLQQERKIVAKHLKTAPQYLTRRLLRLVKIVPPLHLEKMRKTVAVAKMARNTIGVEHVLRTYS